MNSAELRSVSKTFGSTEAVRGVTVTLSPGSVLGIVGGNGSGKSTLMNILSGMFAPDEGTILIRDEEVRFGGPFDAIRLGISMLSQFPEIFPNLDVLENIFLGQELTHRPHIVGLLNRPQMRATARILLARVGSTTIDLQQPAGTLSGGQQKLVALARIIARDSDVYVFDEPTAALGLPQRRMSLELIAALRSAGKSCVLITHDIDELQSICDRVLVLREGRAVAQRSVAELSRQELTDLVVKA